MTYGLTPDLTQQRILKVLRTSTVHLSALEIAVRVPTASRKQVQKALHELQDADAVFLRNGFYRLSEAAKQGDATLQDHEKTPTVSADRGARQRSPDPDQKRFIGGSEDG